ncbi:MAG: hypothetical protein J5726_07245 [Treponema sp.]|nr:hypothetical protein [Treponema sp.]
MKRLLLLSMILMIGMSCISCNLGNQDNNVNNGNPNNSNNFLTSKIKFNFSGAKAVAQLDSSASRSASDDLNTFVKILSDGSFENAITINGNISLRPVIAIYHSPVSDDVFVHFSGITSLGWDQKTNKEQCIGSLICVHSDGSIVDILKVREHQVWWCRYLEYENLYQNLLTFDSAGNLYFVANNINYDSNGNQLSSSGNILYQFNPVTNELTQMVAGVEGTSYSKLQISNDGEWIFVQGSRWFGSTQTYFVRAIPADNPNNFTNIYYSSSNWVSDTGEWWVYDDNSNRLYYITTDGDNSGLFTVSRENNFKDKQFLRTSIGGNLYDLFQDFFDNIITSSQLMEKIQISYSAEIELRIEEYENNSTTSQWEYHTYINTDALEMLKNKYSDSLIAQIQQYGNGGWEYFNAHSYYIYINGTNNYNFWDYFINYNSINQLSATTDGIYGRYFNGNKLCIIHIADAEGNLIEENKKINLPSGKIIDYKEYKNKIFLKYALTTSSGAELGYHHIYAVDLLANEYVNCFENVANRNALEVVSYSIGADRLYFSAVRGTAIENNVVDLLTNEANPLEVNRKMVAIYAF